MKYCFILLLTAFNIAHAQNVGIGTTAPAQKLDVNGTFRSRDNAFFGEKLIIGSTVPSYYKLQVVDGDIAVSSTLHNKNWLLSYYEGYNQFQIIESTGGSGTLRMVINNGGNVGIGTYQPASKLHVNGDVKVSDGEIALTEGVGNSATNKGFVQLSGDNLRIGTYSGNTNGKFVVRVGGTDQLTVNNEGDVTVKGNKGIVYNAASAANLRYYTREASFSVTGLAPQTLSAEATVAFDGGFNSAPVVMVGDIVSNGGTAGQLFALDLKVYGVTANGCKVRLINNGNAPITQNITWNIVCVGN